jgi:threonine aldolase
MREKKIDLRSDTVTRPTPDMRKAMYEAEVGDDVVREDPTVNRLEAAAAERLGKEASLFVPSGTFGNQVSLFTHCDRGDEVIIPEAAHIVQHEAGAASYIAGVHLRTFSPELAYPVWSEIEPRVRTRDDIHVPPTGLIALENALASGEVMPLETMTEVYEKARDFGIPIHLDGARIFNSASYLDVEASQIAGCTDSVMFCLSKGLCAPVGSMVTGTKEFIEKARQRRKIMGGGMRQAGVLAACGLVALEKMTERVHEDREKAEMLAKQMRKLGVFEVRPAKVKINMIFVSFAEGKLAGKEDRFVEALANSGILVYAPRNGWIRFVTHNDVSFEEMEAVCSELSGILEGITT